MQPRFLSASEAHLQAMSLPIAEVVRLLEGLLDATTIAVIGGVNETRIVHSWLRGHAPNRPQVLRFTLQLATMMVSAHDKEICSAWFHGSNPHLDDCVPMIMLRKLPLAEIQHDLIAAARLFASRDGKRT